MAVLHVRSMPDELYEALKRRAHEQGRSLSAEVVFLLRDAVQGPARSQADVLATIARRRHFDPSAAGAPTSTDLIRQDRER
jgi:plasmid stability protein